MGVGNIDVLYEVFVAGGAALHAHASAVLGAEFGERGALDVTKVGDCYHLVFICVEVLRVEFVVCEGDFRAAGIPVAGLEVLGFGFNHVELFFNGAEDFQAALYELHEFVVFVAEFFTVQAGELPKREGYDCGRLGLRESVTVLEHLLGVFPVLGFIADDVDNFINDVHGLQEAFQDMGAFLGFLKLKLRAAHHNLMAELHEFADYLLEAEGAGTAFYKGHVVE